MINYYENAYKILAILQDIAPNLNAQEDCSKAFKDSQQDSENDKEFLLRVTGILYDGLSYGNWPWIKYNP